MPGLCILFFHVCLMSLRDLLFSCGRLDHGKSKGGESYEKWRERKLQLRYMYERINKNLKSAYTNAQKKERKAC